MGNGGDTELPAPKIRQVIIPKELTEQEKLAKELTEQEKLAAADNAEAQGQMENKLE